MLEEEARLGAVVATHHGVFSRDHARRAGFTDREIDRRTGARAWIELHRGVFRLAATPRSWKGEVLAACWAGGFRAYASHRSAAALWGLAGGRTDLVEITCPRWRRARHSSLVVHETKAFDRADMTFVNGIPTATPARTCLELGAVYGPRTVELAVERALQRELTSFDELVRLLHRLGRSGRNGVGTLRRVLAERDPSFGLAESDMERRMVQVLQDRGLPAPVLQFEIRVQSVLIARVDAAYPQWRVAIEYDSDAFHSSVQQRRRDS